MMKSLTQQIERLEAMVGTKDLSDWETDFVINIAYYKDDTSRLSEKQVTTLERLYRKHFGD
jgi:myo-inositol catabolism protein IolC